MAGLQENLNGIPIRTYTNNNHLCVDIRYSPVLPNRFLTITTEQNDGWLSYTFPYGFKGHKTFYYKDTNAKGAKNNVSYCEMLLSSFVLV